MARPVSRSWGSETSCETGVIAMTDKPISPLRQRMIEDMTARHFAEKGPDGLHPIRQELRGFPRSLARHRQRRGPSSVSTAHDEDPCEPVDHQRDHRRTPIL